MDDLLDVDIGKHDYDWLLTPPGTPREPKLERIERKPDSTVPISTTTTTTTTTTNTNTVPKRTPVRSSSTTRASRLSTNTTTQPTENGHGPSTRPIRSSSVTRSRITPTTNTNIRNSNSLNTSSLSLSSSRPSTPTKRAPSLTRPSVPIVSSSRTSRSSTPVKSRPAPPAVTKPNPNSRSSTPTRPRTATSAPSNGFGTRTATSASSSGYGAASSAPRSASRSSTPTRTSSSSTIQSSAPTRTSSSSSIRSSTPTRTASSSSLKRVPSTSGLSSAPSSRPSSPGQRVRPPVRPLDIPDFPNETPPNLRTKLPERPASAGRTRPGMSLTLRGSGQTELVPAVRKSVPVVSRSKVTDGPSKVSPGLSNGHLNNKPVQKPAGTGSDFGRNISKKSLDMAIRHMDIKQNLGGIKGASLFPHSIRSNSNRPVQRPARSSEPPAHSRSTSNDRISENGSLNSSRSNGNNSPDRNILILKESLNEMDLYGSSRYDAMLLKEDAKNTSWLHGIGDEDEKSLIFDHRFDCLPEPF